MYSMYVHMFIQYVSVKKLLVTVLLCSERSLQRETSAANSFLPLTLKRQRFLFHLFIWVKLGRGTFISHPPPPNSPGDLNMGKKRPSFPPPRLTAGWKSIRILLWATKVSSCSRFAGKKSNPTVERFYWLFIASPDPHPIWYRWAWRWNLITIV